MGCSSTSLLKPEAALEARGEFASSPSWINKRMSSFATFSRSSRNSSDSYKKSVSMERQVEKYAYPSPSPPRKRRAELFRGKDFAEVDNHAKSMPMRILYGTMRDVTKYLTKPYDTDVEKLRSLFIWVTTVNVNKLQFCLDQLPKRHSPLEMLLHVHWNMASNANFFAHICRSAGLPCVLVSGVTKSIGYHMGRKVNRRTMAANWNAVFCDGDWRLVDVFLARLLVAGGHKPNDWISQDQPDEDEMFCQLNHKHEVVHVNESFFLMDPDQLIYIHFPDDPAWQLLHRPISEEQFVETAYLRERYFQFGLRVIIPQDYHNELTLPSDDGKVFLEFHMPEDKAKTCHFRYALCKQKRRSNHSSLGLDKYVLYQKGRDFIRYQAQLPTKGEYKFSIFGKDDEEHDAFDLCASFVINCSEASNTAVECYPDCPVIGWGPGRDAERLGITPKSHEDPIIDSVDGKIEIRFGLECRMIVLQSLKHNGLTELQLRKNVTTRMDHDELIVTARLQVKGDYALSLFASRTGVAGELTNICNYILRCHQTTTQKPFPRLHEGIIGAGLHAEWFHIHPKQHTDDKIHTSTGRVSIEMESDDAIPVEMLCELHHNELDTYGLSDCVTSSIVEGHTHLFEISLPQSGEYAANIYARRTEEPKCRVLHVHTYFIESTQAATPHSIAAADYKLQIMQEYVTGNAVMIQLPEGKRPRTTHLIQKNAQLKDVQNEVRRRCAKKMEAFRVHLSEYTEYRLDIFDENSNSTLNHCAQYQIIRNKPARGEVDPDVDAENFEIISEEEQQRRTERNKIEAAHALLRETMHTAMKHHDAAALHDAMGEFEAHGVCEVDGDLTRARLIFDYLQVDKALTNAMHERSLDDLECALHMVQEFGVGMKLGLKLKMAYKIRNQLRRLGALQTDTMMIDDRLINDFREAPPPPEKLQRVLKAMFILMGEKEKTLKNWKVMQGMMRTTQREHFKRRLVTFKMEDLSLETALKAKHFLKDISYLEVRTLSKPCGMFYMWSQGMIEEAERRHAHKKLDSWGSAPEAREKKRPKNNVRSKSR